MAKLKDAASREKALEGLSIALTGQSVDAPEGWKALQAEIAKGNDAKLVALVNRLAVAFRDPAALKRAVAVAGNTGLNADVRTEAVRQLGSIKAPETIALLLTLVRRDSSDAVRAEAARALAGFDKPTIAAELIAGWKDYPRTIRADVVGTLAARKEWAKALLQAMAKKTIDRATSPTTPSSASRPSRTANSTGSSRRPGAAPGRPQGTQRPDRQDPRLAL